MWSYISSQSNLHIITVRKRCLGQDNVFTGVCLFTGRLASQHASQVTWLGGLNPGGCLHPQGVCIQGTLHPGKFCIQGRSASGGCLYPQGVYIRGVCIQGGLYLGWSASRGSASGGSTRPPPNREHQDTVNKRAERIILECILVFMSNTPCRKSTHFWLVYQ